MLKHILKRILISIGILLAVSLIIYGLLRALPANYVELRFGPLYMRGDLTREQFDEIERAFGLNLGFFEGYFRWLGGVFQGNLGYSFSQQLPVGRVIAERMGLSFLISLVSVVISFVIAIPLGVLAAVKQYSKFDYISTALVMMGISLPSFFFSGLIIRTFAVQLNWFPASGIIDPSLPPDTSTFMVNMNRAYHLVLPITVSVILGIGGLMRYTRTNTLEVLRSDFIRTARAKGLGEGTVIFKHAFKNTGIPLATMMAGILPGLFAGSMVIEQLFALPGIGYFAFQALQQGDIPFIMGYNMFLTILSVLGVLLVDITYVIIDPRVKMN